MFKFRLQRILELREQAEQAKARELSSAQDAADAARSIHEQLADLHRSSRAEVDAAHRTAPRIGHLTQLGLVLNALDQRLESAGESVRAADEVVQGAQQQLADAARDRRVLDRLKDRHAEQWRVDAAHKDRLGMDEVALARFSRTADVRAADDAATRAQREQGAQDSPRTNGSTQ